MVEAGESSSEQGGVGGSATRVPFGKKSTASWYLWAASPIPRPETAIPCGQTGQGPSD